MILGVTRQRRTTLGPEILIAPATAIVGDAVSVLWRRLKREEFLKPLGLSQRDLAQRIRVPYQRVNRLVNRRRGITPATALRLAKFFGNSPGFWMNLELRWDLYRAR